MTLTRMPSLAIYVLVLGLSLVKAQTTAVPTVTPNGCPLPTSTGSKGFNVDFWNWDYDDKSVNNDGQILVDGFTSAGAMVDTAGVVVKASGVEGPDVNFLLNPDYKPGTQFGNLYGQSIVSSDFAMNMTGFFFPPATGEYAFRFSADDGIGFRLGNGGTCCGPVSEIAGTKLAVNTFGEGQSGP